MQWFECRYACDSSLGFTFLLIWKSNKISRLKQAKFESEREKEKRAPCLKEVGISKFFFNIINLVKFWMQIFWVGGFRYAVVIRLCCVVFRIVLSQLRLHSKQIHSVFVLSNHMFAIVQSFQIFSLSRVSWVWLNFQNDCLSIGTDCFHSLDSLWLTPNILRYLKKSA